MTLRCPNCGSRRIIFLSTTDGTAVGSTDQRYLCKDCGYRGSFILDDEKDVAADPKKALLDGKETPKQSLQPQFIKKEGAQKALIVTNLVLFLLVLISLALNLAESSIGLALIFSWIVVFLATFMSFSIGISAGTDDWFAHGTLLFVGVLVALIIGIVLGFDVYGIAVLIPLFILAAAVLNWFFVDTSEDELNEDLKRLQEEIK